MQRLESEINGRVLAWFSCGSTSAIAAKMCVEKFGDACEVLYCDTFRYEHSDNRRFFDDVQNWIGREIKVLSSEKYANIFEVFYKTKWLVGVGGARCTTELKKNVRKAYQHVDDFHAFGFTVEEAHRIAQFNEENFELKGYFPLYDEHITKRQCKLMLVDAGIELPTMYKLGYKNNNCIGCVKGGAGYWNKIRQDFPDAFARMAQTERDLNVAINKTYVKGKRIRIFLDELDPDAGRYDVEPDIECGILCGGK